LRQRACSGRDTFTEITWHTGPRASEDDPTVAMTGRFPALPVCPANRTIPRDPDGSPPLELLVVPWDHDQDEPTDCWISNLPPDKDLTRW
jgi:hypothetical protein